MGWPGDVLHDPRRAGAQQRAGRLIFHGPATSMASGPSPTSGRHARQMTASTQSGWSRPCKSSSASIPPPARSRRSSSSPSTLHRGVRGARLVPVSPSQPRANGLGAPLAVQTTTTSRAVAYGFRSPVPVLASVTHLEHHTLAMDDDQERRWGLLLLGKGAVLAHQFGCPHVLSWTTTSSRGAAPGAIAIRDWASWPGSARAIACASMMQHISTTTSRLRSRCSCSSYRQRARGRRRYFADSLFVASDAQYWWRGGCSPACRARHFRSR